jgi:drug/metabolite transporter (DMT)-like permease
LSVNRLAWWSLAAVCFFWGTTYLGIRVALEGFSPALLVATRFLLSGLLILAYALVKGWKMPRGADLWWPAGTGLLTLGVGNYCLSLSETLIPSGLAALFITVAPFWMIGADALVPGGERVRPVALLAMLVGLSGAVMLIGPDAWASGWSGKVVQGFLILQLSCLGWSLGSILQKRRGTRIHPVLMGAVQQLSAGMAFLGICAATGDWNVEWSARVGWAVVYLALFGSIVAYSAYLYALQHLPVAIVSIYTYVNPVVAVTLGWLFYSEQFGRRELVGMAVIFLGVWLTKKVSAKP